MSASETIWLGADGKREYPCRCGVTHRGDYAAEDWNHHNCFHREPLQEILPGYLICMPCGETFRVAAGGAEGDTE